MDIFRPWADYMPPCRISDNVYFVGALGGSSHVIDSGEGLIMLDTGYPQTLYQVFYNMSLLGLDPKNIKHIIHSHGHYDHLGATKALVELTGAKTYIGILDKSYADGTEDLTWARELGAAYYEAFTPDVLISDGDVITIGNTRFECVHTPGHTPGTMSYFFNTTYKGKPYVCGTHGGVGLNTMRKEFLEKYSLPYTCREDFLKGLDKVENRHVDIFIGNHVHNNGMLEKVKQMTDDFNPFINENDWGAFIRAVRRSALELINDPKQQP